MAKVNLSGRTVEVGGRVGEFRVFFSNLGWFCDTTAPTLERAINLAKAKGFDATIYGPYGGVVASWSIIGGTKKY